MSRTGRCIRRFRRPCPRSLACIWAILRSDSCCIHFRKDMTRMNLRIHCRRIPYHRIWEHRSSCQYTGGWNKYWIRYMFRTNRRSHRRRSFCPCSQGRIADTIPSLHRMLCPMDRSRISRRSRCFRIPFPCMMERMRSVDICPQNIVFRGLCSCRMNHRSHQDRIHVHCNPVRTLWASGLPYIRPCIAG